jgi:hypothetical protein
MKYEVTLVACWKYKKKWRWDFNKPARSFFHCCTLLAINISFTLPTNNVSDPDWIQIQSGQWIRIRIQEGESDPQK